ncbi:MAG: decarboxylating NADP(+)-dependent phosphogluconate dehydrogenase [Rubrivivax sp.]|nr:decarboxylating NADP(+)-dependent phosphogluconate dehydrogenase [Rubrivivax sp.]
MPAANAANPFGLVGLAVMGQNLVLNIESRGFAVSVYNRSGEVTEAFAAAHPGKRLTATKSLPELVATLARPRKILLMVKAGGAVDAVLDQLVPLLEAGDIVIDGGNSHYTDTERRDAALAAKGLRFVGCGVSGGEEGARKGPSIMPGGPASAWQVLKPIFESIAAKVGPNRDEPCVMHIGEGGAGHYVKMVHNGIEYGDMQLICEAYALMQAAGMGTDAMADVFARWNDGELQSYLIEITSHILRQRDADTGAPLVDVILDKAGQKGTGQWTLASAADNAVVVSTINAAVEARVLSSMKAARVAASTRLQGPAPRLAMPAAELVPRLHEALYASKIVSYAQGLDLMRTMGEKKGWNLDLGGIARIWRGGCIIRARFLGHIAEAWRAPAGAPANLMLAPFFEAVLNRAQAAWREVVAMGVTAGVPVPAMGASLAYYDAYRSARLPANLLQAQRDFFGAHTYERIDRPAGRAFHTQWPEVIG